MTLTAGSCATRKEADKNIQSKEVKETKYVGTLTPASLTSVFPPFKVDMKVTETTKVEIDEVSAEVTKTSPDTAVLADAVVKLTSIVDAMQNPVRATGSIAKIFTENDETGIPSDTTSHVITGIISALTGAIAVDQVARRRRKKLLAK